MAERDYNSWVNDDGLRIRFGPGEALVSRGGQTADAAGIHRIEIEVLADDLKAHNDSTDPTTVLDWNTRIPAGAFLKSAELTILTAFAGATATLAVGLVQASDQEAAFTDEDPDGLIAATAVTSIDAEGDVVTGAGALVGTTLGSDSGGYLVSAEAGTATFTAGEGRLVIEYFMP